MKHLSEISTTDIANMARVASLQARDKALDAGLEVSGIDKSGSHVSIKKDAGGNITRTVKEGTDPNAR